MFEFENNYLLLWVDKTIHLMYSDWLRPVTSEEYKEGNKILLQQLREKEVENWIADSSKLGDISKEDEKWTLKELVPKLANTNLLKLARIGGEDTGSHAKFEQFVKRADPIYIGNIQVRQFTTYKEAADWVGEIPV
ncbi:hypothetical protein H8S95_07705 [Pontibacter sp. KCTC 32443]|uniref:hypothetical protein n=1 Tax=Pontibacter TaxID=323449 RepID=UPI00164D6782|nr:MULTISPECIES: hypothetical protein [Pontibacter]MBC5773944.1 hypothetical protein [Pontibacter sp. KCTC 32443]